MFDFSKYIGKTVVTRGVQSGVYYGKLAAISEDGKVAELTGCRNIWYWSGANNLHQLAAEGVKNKADSQISMAVERVVFTDVCELVPCTEEAISCLDSVEDWKC